MNCECVFCKNNKPFDMPQEIIEASKNGELALFCGAGISTENRNVLPYTFYESIKSELGIKDEDIRFSELMQRYSDKPNGRRKLLQKIRERFEYIHSFPELEQDATKFHRELVELYFIKTIITTNWDTYFEDYCGATPITIPEDVIFMDESERCVLKIHGSISNLGTIIATSKDYKKCKKDLDKGIIGATLKTILAKNTVVFIGFSFGDEDFEQILTYIQREMKDVFPHIFIVTLDEGLQEKVGYKNITSIVTDGAFFLHRLKLMLTEEGLIENCHSMPMVDIAYDSVRLLHEKVSHISFSNYPCVIFCLAYQDGVQHAFSRYFCLYKTGKYNIPGRLNASAHAYEKIIQGKEKQKNYWDVAYYEGYLNGLIFIAACESESGIIDEFPFFFLPNAKKVLSSYEVFLEELKRITSKPDKYHRYAVKRTERFKNPDTTFHHPPY